MEQLFSKEQAPRAKPRKLMHVVDAGSGSAEGHHVHFVCGHCWHDDGWAVYDDTISELKRGLPCQKCNGTDIRTADAGGMKMVWSM